MTNYMELIMTNQPWNLIFFMAIPVILAESLVITEFYILWRGERSSAGISSASKVLGIIIGIYFAFVVIYLSLNVLPALEWRGLLDEIAVMSYLIGAVPLLGITLLEIGLVGKNLNDKARRQAHFLLLTVFLILSHLAMIFGMTEPQSQHEHMHHAMEAG